MDARKVLRRPLLTEKATVAREMENEYAFEVDMIANKIEIKKAVESRFGVKVKSVRTIIMQGKVKRIGAHEGKRADRKKALIKLQEGQSIDLFDEL